jgi:hypothetical protein
MTPVVPAPIMLPDFLSCPCAQVFGALVALFTTLVYLALVWSPFWLDAATKPPETEQPQDTFHTGEEK